MSQSTKQSHSASVRHWSNCTLSFDVLDLCFPDGNFSSFKDIDCASRLSHMYIVFLGECPTISSLIAPALCEFSLFSGDDRSYPYLDVSENDFTFIENLSTLRLCGILDPLPFVNYTETLTRLVITYGLNSWFENSILQFPMLQDLSITMELIMTKLSRIDADNVTTVVVKHIHGIPLQQGTADEFTSRFPQLKRLLVWDEAIERAALFVSISLLR